MLDSSVLIDAERGRVDLDARLAALGDQPLALAAVSASELLHGVHRARDASQRRRRQRFVEAILSDLTVVDFSLVEARVHAQLWAELASRGISVGAHDLLIAATAIANGLRLATSNVRDFHRVP